MQGVCQTRVAHQVPRHEPLKPNKIEYLTGIFLRNIPRWRSGPVSTPRRVAGFRRLKPPFFDGRLWDQSLQIERTSSFKSPYAEIPKESDAAYT
jgi:hypothetical protein